MPCDTIIISCYCNHYVPWSSVLYWQTVWILIIGASWGFLRLSFDVHYPVAFGRWSRFHFTLGSRRLNWKLADVSYQYSACAPCIRRRWGTSCVSLIMSISTLHALLVLEEDEVRHVCHWLCHALDALWVSLIVTVSHYVMQWSHRVFHCFVLDVVDFRRQ